MSKRAVSHRPEAARARWSKDKRMSPQEFAALKRGDSCATLVAQLVCDRANKCDGSHAAIRSIVVTKIHDGFLLILSRRSERVLAGPDRSTFAMPGLRLFECDSAARRQSITNHPGRSRNHSRPRGLAMKGCGAARTQTTFPSPIRSVKFSTGTSEVSAAFRHADLERRMQQLVDLRDKADGEAAEEASMCPGGSMSPRDPSFNEHQISGLPVAGMRRITWATCDTTPLWLPVEAGALEAAPPGRGFGLPVSEIVDGLVNHENHSLLLPMARRGWSTVRGRLRSLAMERMDARAKRDDVG